MLLTRRVRAVQSIAGSGYVHRLPWPGAESNQLLTLHLPASHLRSSSGLDEWGSCSSTLCLQLDLEQCDSRAPGGTQAGQHHQDTWNGNSVQQGSLNTHSAHNPQCAAPTAHSTLHKKGMICHSFEVWEDIRELPKGLQQQWTPQLFKSYATKSSSMIAMKITILFYFSKFQSKPSQWLPRSCSCISIK